jgi:hypothetical protein
MPNVSLRNKLRRSEKLFDDGKDMFFWESRWSPMTCLDWPPILPTSTSHDSFRGRSHSTASKSWRQFPVKSLIFCFVD